MKPVPPNPRRRPTIRLLVRWIATLALVAPIALALPAVALQEEQTAPYHVLDYSSGSYRLSVEKGIYDALIDNRGTVATEVEMTREDGKVVWSKSVEYEGVTSVPISQSANYTLAFQGEGRFILADSAFIYNHGMKSFIQSTFAVHDLHAYTLSVGVAGGSSWICIQTSHPVHAQVYDHELDLAVDEAVTSHFGAELGGHGWGAILLQPVAERVANVTLTQAVDPLECTATEAVVSSPLADADASAPAVTFHVIVAMCVGLAWLARRRHGRH